MKKFLVLDQNEEAIFDTQYNEFTCSIVELYGLYVVRVNQKSSNYNFAVAVYLTIQEAEDAISDLEDFALKVAEPDHAFAFPSPQEPISALDVIQEIEARIP